MEEYFLHASSLSSSFGRVFKEDLVPDWRRRLFAHPFLFLPPEQETEHTINMNLVYRHNKVKERFEVTDTDTMH